MKSNEKQYKCYSIPQRKFLEQRGLESWDRGLDWNTNKPFWYFEHDKEGKLSESLKIWSEKRNISSISRVFSKIFNK